MSAARSRAAAGPERLTTHLFPRADQLETNRFASNANVTNFDLIDTYLVPYAAAFTRANVQGSMCAYDSINSRPACADAWLLTSMVREYWNRSDAYHLSDCGAIEDQFSYKHTATSVADATAQSVAAGCDGCAGSAFIMDGGLADSVAAGALSEAQIDAAVTRLFTQRFRLGMFDPPAASVYTTYGPEKIGTADARAAAELAAAQGAVLLQNTGGILPLDAASPALRSIAVLGPHATSQRDLLGDFYGASASQPLFDSISLSHPPSPISRALFQPTPFAPRRRRRATTARRARPFACPRWAPRCSPR